MKEEEEDNEDAPDAAGPEDPPRCSRGRPTSGREEDMPSTRRNFAQNNFWFFDLVFKKICFPTLSKRFF